MSVSSPPSSSSPSSPSSFSSINWDPLCSVWRAGPQWQLGSSQFSVACWTPIATGILSVQCGVLDPNRDLMSSVWRAGPQPRYCEFSVACWTPTAILRVECGVLDPNRDSASSVWRAGPQPRYCVLSVACWTPERVVKEVVARCHKINQIECQQICLQEVQKNDKKNGGKKREIINLPQNISEVILGFLCKGNNNNGIGDQKCRPIFLAGSLRT